MAQLSNYSILKRFCQALMLSVVLFMAGSTPVSASAQDFYFESADFDYYLEGSDSGTTLKVVETLTAVFPDEDQNHGIEREIPFTNQGGKNVTLKNLQSLSVKRNGASEPYTTSKKSDYFYVRIGDADEYVHGTQVYTLEYEFINVITEFEDSTDGSYQQIYWDTNGTDWPQEFEELTATLHLGDYYDKIDTDEIYCYVGRYGEKGQDRCEIAKSESDQTITFETSELDRFENLTFAVNFDADTFTVPPLEPNFALVITFLISAAISGLILYGSIHSYKKRAKDRAKRRDKKSYYKSLFVKPEYTPIKDLTVAEAREIYLKDTKDPHVATLLELAISGYITIKKIEPKHFLGSPTIIIEVNKLDGITDSQKYLLRILDGGGQVKAGDKIEIKKRRSTSHLSSLNKSYYSHACTDLLEKGYLETYARKSDSHNPSITSQIFLYTFLLVAFSPLIVVLLMFLLCVIFDPDMITNEFLQEFNFTGDLIGDWILPRLTLQFPIIAIITSICLADYPSKYDRYTKKGLEASIYLDGLKEYIQLAEADRLAVLQSVDGADTSPEGVVKLYEKLLPYAALFGLEKSWMKELNRYYNLNEVSSPNWCDDVNFTDIATFSIISHSVSSSINSAVYYHESSDGSFSSSSSSSGSGGGGFSGGGGGGGGGGGW